MRDSFPRLGSWTMRTSSRDQAGQTVDRRVKMTTDLTADHRRHESDAVQGGDGPENL